MPALSGGDEAREGRIMVTEQSAAETAPENRRQYRCAHLSLQVLRKGRIFPMKLQYHHIIRENPDADTAVILLHGILCAPQYFDFLMSEIPDTFSVYGILLDGHGAETDGLAHTSMQRWKQQTEELMQRILPQYQNIIIAAHSMGTLFALELAAKYPEHIRKMLLLGVPLRVHLTLSGAARSVAAAFGFRAKRPLGNALQNAYSIQPDRNPLHYIGWIPRYLELFREIRAVRKRCRDIRVPCEVYQSAKDELVSLRALPLLAEMPAVKLHVLRHSTHFYYPPQDMARVLSAFGRVKNTAK